MAGKNINGAIDIYVTKELFNTLISVLTVYIIADENNRYSQSAMKLKKKIMNYGREFEYENNPNVAIHFFPDEAALLIKMFIIYSNALEEPSEDFFELFHKNKIERKKI